MIFSSNYASNPQTSSKPSEEKIAQLKKEQEARRAKFSEELEESRVLYEEAKKDCAEAQSIFIAREQELARHEESDQDYDKYEKEYRTAKKKYSSADSDKTLRLQFLQYRTDSYVRAHRINVLDLAG